MINKEQEKYIKEIAEKFNNGIQIILPNDKSITINDVKKLGDYDKAYIEHKKGFKICVYKSYTLETVLNIPVIFFNNKYCVADELLGKHAQEWSLKDCVEYVNGLLGY